MNAHKRLTLCFLTSLLIAPMTAQAEPFMASGKAMAQQCAPCHGTNGQEFHEAMPPLAGMQKAEFIKAMIAYREGTRAAIIMDRVARGFTNEEINAMAEWFQKQPVKPWNETSLQESLSAQTHTQTGDQL